MSESVRNVVEDEPPYINDDAFTGGEIDYRNTESTVPTPPFAPDPLYTDLARFFQELLPVQRRQVLTTTARIPISANQPPRMILPTDPNRIRARTFTDNNNTAPIAVSTQYSSDIAASLSFAADSDWFVWHGTDAHYATSAASGYLYIVVERQG